MEPNIGGLVLAAAALAAIVGGSVVGVRLTNAKRRRDIEAGRYDRLPAVPQGDRRRSGVLRAVRGASRAGQADHVSGVRTPHQARREVLRGVRSGTVAGG